MVAAFGDQYSLIAKLILEKNYLGNVGIWDGGNVETY